MSVVTEIDYRQKTINDLNQKIGFLMSEVAHRDSLLERDRIKIEDLRQQLKTANDVNGADLLHDFWDGESDEIEVEAADTIYCEYRGQSYRLRPHRLVYDVEAV